MNPNILKNAMEKIVSRQVRLPKVEPLKIYNGTDLLPTHKPLINIWSKEFDWSITDTCNKDNIYKIYKMIPNIKTGLFIYGPAGTGKTTIAVNLINRWKTIYKTDKRYTVHTYDWFDLCDCIKTLPDYRDQRQFATLFNLQSGFKSNYCLTVIDDFAGGRITDYVADTFEKYIRDAEKKGALIIFTSNITPKKIIEIWNDQLWSRIAGMTIIIELRGKDRRGN